MHDKNGVELKVGDRVTIEMTVTSLSPGAETCNISLSRKEEGEQELQLTGQAKQCEIVQLGDEEPFRATDAAGKEV